MKEMLEEIKAKEEHKSFDSVIRTLIYEHWEDRGVNHNMVGKGNVEL